MKLPIVILPTLLQVAAFAAICHATPAVPKLTLTRAERVTEIRRLHRECAQIQGQIAELSSRRGFLPRGVGYVSGDTQDPTAFRQTTAK